MESKEKKVFWIKRYTKKNDGRDTGLSCQTRGDKFVSSEIWYK